MSLSGSAAKLLASLDLDTKPFERGAGRVDKSLGAMEGKFGRVSARTVALGSAVGVGIERLAEKGIGFLFDQIRSGEEGLRLLQDTTAQTGAVIESTGGKAGVTAAKVRELAEAQESLTTVDDKVIQSGENMLLTFTGIGSEVFPRATKAMVDMAVAMNGGNAEGIDLKTTAIQIGKALNDPIKGVTALRKVGVQLTDQQEKQIKTFIKNGDLMGAQTVILKELEKEFGKAGEAAGTSGAAGVRRLNDAVEDTQISLATGLAPALERIRGKIATALADPKTQAAVKHLGEWLGDAAEQGIAFAEKIPWGQVADGIRTAAGFAGKLVDVFVHMPPQVQGTILALAGLNKLSGGAVTGIVGDLAKGLVKGVLGMTAGVVNAKAAVVNVAGGVSGGGVPGAAGGAVGAAKGGLSLLSKVFLVGEAIGLVAAVGEVASAVSAAGLVQAQDIHTTLKESLASPQTTAELKTKLDAINTGLAQLPHDPIGAFLFKDTIAELEKMRGDVVAAINAQQAPGGDQADELKRIAQLLGNPPKPPPPQGVSPEERDALQRTKALAGDQANELVRIRQLLSVPPPAQGLSPEERDALARQTAAITGLEPRLEAIRAAVAKPATADQSDELKRIAQLLNKPPSTPDSRPRPVLDKSNIAKLDRIAALTDRQKTEITATKNALSTKMAILERRETETKSGVVAQTRSSGSSIVSALQALPAPTVNLDVRVSGGQTVTVTKSYQGGQTLTRVTTGTGSAALQRLTG